MRIGADFFLSDFIKDIIYTDCIKIRVKLRNAFSVEFTWSYFTVGYLRLWARKACIREVLRYELQGAYSLLSIAFCRHLLSGLRSTSRV